MRSFFLFAPRWIREGRWGDGVMLGWGGVLWFPVFARWGSRYAACSAVMLCSSGMGLFTKCSPYRLPQIPKKKIQAEHSVMRTVTKNTLQSQRCGLVELHGRLCGKMLLGNWVLFCNRLCSALSTWASKCRLRSFVCVAVSVYRPHVCWLNVYICCRQAFS